MQSGEPDVIFFAPRRSICRIADQCSEARLQTLPDWIRLLETAFRSLPTAARFRITIERSKLPTYFFASPIKRSSNPFGLPLPHQRLGLFPFAPVLSTQQARCLTLAQRSQAVIGSPLPFGVFGPSGSERSTRSTTREVRLDVRPVFPSLPDGLLVFH